MSPATARARLLVALWWSLLLGCGADEPDPILPNIVLVIGDDHGYGDYGFMGSEIARTPNLDRLAAHGTVFTHGYNTASICRPSLRSILTGLLPIQWETYRTERAVLREKASEGGIMETLDTLPRLLASRGYVSFQSGKYWGGNFASGGFSEGMGYDTSIGRRTFEPVFAFIDRNAETPFFIWYAPMLPHIPHHTPPEYAAATAPGLPAPVAAYHASVSWFDAGVGKLVAHLEERNLRERTLIVCISDNGWEAVADPGDYGGKFAGMVGGSKGKGSLYELGYRSPFVFSWPGQVPEGRRSDALVSSIDLLPTLLDYVGLPPIERLLGHSLRPVIDGDLESVRTHLIGSANAGRKGYFYRDPRWHYVRYAHREPELYDMQADPDETTNVAAQHPDITRRARERIQAWIPEVLAAPVERPAARSSGAPGAMNRSWATVAP